MTEIQNPPHPVPLPSGERVEGEGDFGYLHIWIWNLFGIWSLGFGILNYGGFLVPAIHSIKMAEGPR
jgi:hypothetical protein